MPGTSTITPVVENTTGRNATRLNFVFPRLLQQRCEANDILHQMKDLSSPKTEATALSSDARYRTLGSMFWKH